MNRRSRTDKNSQHKPGDMIGKMFKGLILVLMVIVILALVGAIFVRNEYAVERQVTINRPETEVFQYIKHLKNQDKFSVWSHMDPNMRRTYIGIDGNVGFVSTWESNYKNLGKGEQEITNIIENERIDLKVRFKEPVEAEDSAYMITEALSKDRTRVKWGFEGEMAYPMNLMLLFKDMEGMLGNDLQAGLNNLKSILEK